MMMTIKEWWSNTVQVCGTWWWSRNNYCAPPFPPEHQFSHYHYQQHGTKLQTETDTLKIPTANNLIFEGWKLGVICRRRAACYVFKIWKKCLEIRGCKNTGCFFSDCTRVWLALLLKLVSSGSIVGVKVDLISPRCLVRVPLSGTMLRLLCDWGTIFTFTLPFDGSGDRSRQVFISGAGQLDLVLKATLVN